MGKGVVYRLSVLMGVGLWVISGCAAAAPRMIEPIPSTTSIPSGNSRGSWIQVYFSDPPGERMHSFRGGPDEKLAQAIHEARIRVDMAAYDLDLWSVRNALIAAHRRGVKVRLVIESDHENEPEVEDIIQAGIPVVGDDAQALMHNKFVIIDGAQVWTGSMNFTINGAYKNNNHLLVIQSPRIAENFTREFNEMFQDRFFGILAIQDTPYPFLDVNGTLIETYFSPDDGTAGHILEHLRSAKQSIYILAFSFTSDPIARMIIEKAGEGVVVMGVFDEGQYYSNTGTEFDRLCQAGIDIRLDGNPARMHHKVLIIDEEVVITGSYNFSASAETLNDENTLIIANPDLALAMINEFERVYSQAQKPDR